MMTILVTGGIGSGKSQVCRFLSEAGIPVYDSDSRAKKLYDESSDLAGKIAARFGTSVLGPDGHVDRKALAQVVFADKDALSDLEAIVHPAVYDDFRKFCKSQSAEMIAFESAIALERGFPEGIFDKVVFVDAPEAERVARAASRDHRGEGEIRKRVAAQSSCAEDSRIDETIVNDGSLDDLRRATVKLIEKFKR